MTDEDLKVRLLTLTAQATDRVLSVLAAEYFDLAPEEVTEYHKAQVRERVDSIIDEAELLA